MTVGRARPRPIPAPVSRAPLTALAGTSQPQSAAPARLSGRQPEVPGGAKSRPIGARTTCRISAPPCGPAAWSSVPLPSDETSAALGHAFTGACSSPGGLSPLYAPDERGGGVCAPPRFAIASEAQQGAGGLHARGAVDLTALRLGDVQEREGLVGDVDGGVLAGRSPPRWAGVARRGARRTTAVAPPAPASRGRAGARSW
jgi:hypothetical protein